MVKKKKEEKKNTILNAFLLFSWACGSNWFRHRLQYAGMILKLILHVLELDCGHARQYAGTELSKSWALFYMCWCWTVALQSFRSPSVAIKARVCPATRYCSLLPFHRKAIGSQPPSYTLMWLGALQSALNLPLKPLCCHGHWPFAAHYASHITIILDSYQVPHQWWEISTFGQMFPRIQWGWPKGFEVQTVYQKLRAVFFWEEDKIRSGARRPCSSKNRRNTGLCTDLEHQHRSSNTAEQRKGGCSKYLCS